MYLALARRLLCGVTLALLCPLPGLAAEPPGGTVSGAVAAVDGKPVPGARIRLDGPTHLVGLTAPDGRFTIAGVAPGSYSASVRAPRFAPATMKLNVRAGATTTLSFALAQASLTTIGHVEAGDAAAPSTKSAPATTIDAQSFADQGYTRVSDVLADDDNATLVHAAGGASNVLPTSIAVRAPDPADTTIDIDGHQVNNGNTGDFDLSLLDPADFSTIDVLRGVSPSSLLGPESIGGTINVHTLDPTVDPPGLLRLNLGSFSGFGATLQSTGTVDGRLGYALSMHRQGSAGEVNEPIYNLPTGNIERVGSGALGSSALGKLRYSFGAASAGYAEFTFRDQSSFRDLSAALSAYPGTEVGTISVIPPPAGLPGLLGFAGTALQAHDAGYGFDLSLPLGAVDASGAAPTSLLLRHSTSLVDQSVTGPGAEISPYLFNDRDRLDDESLQIDHRLGLGELTLQYDVRNEGLRTNFQDGETEAKPLTGAFPPRPLLAPAADLDQLELGQTQRSLVLRYAYNPTQSLHFTAATGYSDLSLFGSHIDPRFGFVWTPGSRTSLRFSVGTTYQSPLLPELVVPNPLPIVSGGYVSIGNPNLKPDHATEYDLGFDRVLFGGAHQTDISADVYRVNLRTPASQLLPPLDPKCGPLTSTGDGTPCPLSYPVNAGDGVFQGIELSAQRRLGTAVTLRASYAVHSSYLSALPAYFQEGALVQGEQTLGLPLHKGTLSLTGAPLRGLIYGASVVYEGAYNELNRPPFATLGARLGYRFRNGYEIGVAGTNLSDVYAQRFTRTGLGVPYGGSGEVIATDAYALQGRAYALTLTRRF